LRQSDHPLSGLSEHYDENTTQIWAELQLPENYPAAPRTKLAPHETLIIWSAPPNKFLLRHAIEIVSPQHLILVAVNPPALSLDDFIQSLLGLIKHQIQRDKPFQLTRFAEALALPEEVIEAGLAWIHQHGDFNLDKIQQGSMLPGPGKNLPGFENADKLLKHLLREVIAYRAYFKKAHIRAIL
jgi:hypothetical protein